MRKISQFKNKTSVIQQRTDVVDGPLDLAGSSLQENCPDSPLAVREDLENSCKRPRPRGLVFELDRHQGSDF